MEIYSKKHPDPDCTVHILMLDTEELEIIKEGIEVISEAEFKASKDTNNDKVTRQEMMSKCIICDKMLNTIKGF